MTSAPMTNEAVGIWCWRRDDVHQMNSVLSAWFSTKLYFVLPLYYVISISISTPRCQFWEQKFQVNQRMHIRKYPFEISKDCFSHGRKTITGLYITKWRTRNWVKTLYQAGGSSKCPDDDLRVHPLFYKWLALLQKLSRQQNDTCSSITNLVQYNKCNMDTYHHNSTKLRKP